MCNQEDIPIMQPSEQAGISVLGKEADFVAVTPEMALAGAFVLDEWSGILDAPALAEKVYTAMRTRGAAPLESHQGAETQGSGE